MEYLVKLSPHPDREGVKAVDKRANVLTEEYNKKARNVDRVYGGAAEGTVGRVQRKLMDFGQVRGLVFGAFGEASEGVHELVHHLDNSWLKAEGLQQGRDSGKGGAGGCWWGKTGDFLVMPLSGFRPNVS